MICRMNQASIQSILLLEYMLFFEIIHKHVRQCLIQCSSSIGRIIYAGFPYAKNTRRNIFTTTEQALTKLPSPILTLSIIQLPISIELKASTVTLPPMLLSAKTYCVRHCQSMSRSSPYNDWRFRHAHSTSLFNQSSLQSQ